MLNQEIEERRALADKRGEEQVCITLFEGLIDKAARAEGERREIDVIHEFGRKDGPQHAGCVLDLREYAFKKAVGRSRCHRIRQDTSDGIECQSFEFASVPSPVEGGEWGTAQLALRGAPTQMEEDDPMPYR